MTAIEPQPRPEPLPGPYLVVGLGKAGRSAAAALATAFSPDAVRVWTGFRTEGERHAREMVRALGVEVSIGEAAGLAEVARNPGCVVKSPGMSLAHPVLAAALARGLPVVDELELGWRLGRAPLVGVTGTDGKGTVCHLVARCLEEAGVTARCTGNRLHDPALSAVDEPDDGWLVCEASSYQLESTTAFLPEVGVLTNLTHEHLHRHGDMAGYAASKRLMFVRGERCVRVAVTDADGALGARLAREVAQRGGRAVTFGRSAGDYRVGQVAWTLESSDLELETPSGRAALRTRLAGRHNALNVAAALATAEALGVEREVAISALEAADPVPGRLQLIDAGQSFDAIVDFAHTPAAVAAVLQTLRHALDQRGGGRLLAVVGVVGGSDPSKRAPIGRTAAEAADIAIFTSGAPGAERPEAIAGALAGGARDADGRDIQVEPDRRGAIERAVELAEPGDMLVVLGRGSMPRMRVTPAGDEVAFDDREVLRESILARQAV